MDKSVILFDLDGTLTDPKEGITKCVAYALDFFGIYVENLDVLKVFIGPPLANSFSYYFDFNEEETAFAIKKYRERVSEIGWAENKVYGGMKEMLSALKKAGKKLVVATSKPEEFAVKIMKHFGLFEYFDLVCGAPMNPPKGHGKADVIRDALKRANVTDIGTAIMVGDRLHDTEGAHALGIPSVGVLWGYGDEKEHKACGSDFIVKTVEELKSMLLVD